MEADGTDSVTTCEPSGRNLDQRRAAEDEASRYIELASRIDDFAKERTNAKLCLEQHTIVAAIARMKSDRAQAKLGCSDAWGALSEYLGLLHLARQLSRGRVTPLVLLTTSTMQLAALHGIYAVAKQLPDDIGSISGCLVFSANDYAIDAIQSLYAELGYVHLPSLKAIRQGGDVCHTIEDILTLIDCPGGTGGVSKIVEAQLNDILKDHPRPFELNDTIELLQVSTSAAVDSFSHNHVRPTALLEVVLQEQRLRIKPMYEVVQRGGVETTTISRIREDTLVIDNPLGRLIAFLLATDSGFCNSMRAHESRRRGMALACHVGAFLFENNRIPVNLAELLSKGYLTCLPDDPLSGGPYLYSRERLCVWSSSSGQMQLPNKEVFEQLDAAGIVWPVPTKGRDQRWLTTGVT